MKLLSVIAVILFSQSLFAKDDLINRLGLGYSQQSVINVPAIAVHYQPNEEFVLTGALAMDTQKDNSKFLLNAGLRTNIYKEQNLNFFAGGTVGLVNDETNGKGKNGIELTGQCGVEFFFAGLENLGFNFETGVSITSIDSTRFRTFGDSPVRAGIFFYF